MRSSRLTMGSSLLLMAMLAVVGAHETAVARASTAESKLACTVCELAMGTLRSVVAANASVDCISFVAAELCTLLKVGALPRGSSTTSDRWRTRSCATAPSRSTAPTSST